MVDLGLVILRATVGSLLAGHGAQKLWGLFGGYGVEGTAGFMHSLGLRPGRFWAIVSGLTEFGGGVLTALGLLNPLGPIQILGAMTVATLKVHWAKPIWTSSGGAELPAVNAAAALTVALAGPGRFSLDRLFHIRTPRWIQVLALLAAAAGAANAVQTGLATPAPSQEEESGGELQAGTEAEHPA